MYLTYRLLGLPMAFAAGAIYQFCWMVAHNGTPLSVNGPEWHAAMPPLLIITAIVTATMSYKLVNTVCDRAGVFGQ